MDPWILIIFLDFFSCLTRILSPTLYWWVFQCIFSCLVSRLFCNCLHCQMCSQSSTCLIFKMTSRQNTICIGDVCSVVQLVTRTANMFLARMPDHGLLLTMLDTLNAQKIFPIIWWIRLMISLDWGFLVGIGYLFRT